MTADAKLKARALEWLRNETTYGTEARYAKVILEQLEGQPSRLTDERIDEIACSVRNPNRTQVRRLLRLAADEAAALIPSATRSTVPIEVRPMLVCGQLAKDPRGPIILIDSEQEEHEQVVSLWHETLHLLGMTDEATAEAIAQRLAQACPTVLRGLKSNINVLRGPHG